MTTHTVFAVLVFQHYPDQKHIMIGYQHGSKERVKKLREKLREEGYNVWIDYEQMSRLLRVKQ